VEKSEDRLPCRLVVSSARANPSAVCEQGLDTTGGEHAYIFSDRDRADGEGGRGVEASVPPRVADGLFEPADLAGAASRGERSNCVEGGTESLFFRRRVCLTGAPMAAGAKARGPPRGPRPEYKKRTAHLVSVRCLHPLRCQIVATLPPAIIRALGSIHEQTQRCSSAREAGANGADRNAENACDLFVPHTFKSDE
jgi:hypothetical protein